MSDAADVNWERFLWETHHVVAVSVAEVQELEPLDVLVKLQSRKTRNGFTIRKVPVSLDWLRKEESSEQWGNFHKRWQTSSENVKRTMARGRIMTGSRRNQLPVEVLQLKSDLPGEIRFVDGYSNSCLCSLLLSCGFERNKRFEACAQDIRSVSLSPHEIMPIFKADSPAWKLDVTKLKQVIPWADLPRSQTPSLELWVVTHVKFCRLLSLTWKKGGGTEAGVDVPAEAVAALTTTAFGVPVPVPIRASLHVVHDEEMLTASSANSSLIPFAFKAIRLVYDRESGELVSKPLDKGEQPQRRGQGSIDTDAEKLYNMAEFFETDEDGHLVFQCLEMDVEPNLKAAGAASISLQLPPGED